MRSTLRGVRQKWDVIFIERRGWVVSHCSGRAIFNFFTEENWICTMTRHHAEPNINILLPTNLSFDYDIRQWTHPLVILLCCFWAKLNCRTCDQFECDVTWFCFHFDFVCSHAWCACCSIVCSHFEVVQIKHWLQNEYRKCE